jgi:hypothetical protein
MKPTGKLIQELQVQQVIYPARNRGIIAMVVQFAPEWTPNIRPVLSLCCFLFVEMFLKFDK